MSENLVIAITMGDPAGVGPEISLKAAAQVKDICTPVIVGDRAVLEQVAEKLSLPLPETVLDCRFISDAVEPGKLDKAYGEASFGYVISAIEGAKDGRFDAVVTAPIAKAAWHLAGIYENGHTEVFAKACGIEDYAMMFWSPRLVVSLCTCHQSLESVPHTLTAERIHTVTRLTGEAIRKIEGKEPKLAVLGLNPHAGEAGAFGTQDDEIIAPAIELAKAEGWDVTGPMPADAAFMPHNLPAFDGFVTMYHDQGTIPFKMISMHDGVNTTLGLPIIRTSVDHGTAFDIAWQNKASESSLVSAIQLAVKLAQK
ncbi:4-hydroxythreonine-4-phosphate dehydrogenase PdxA [Verrucomicrobiota bacterium]